MRLKNLQTMIRLIYHRLLRCRQQIGKLEPHSSWQAGDSPLFYFWAVN